MKSRKTNYFVNINTLPVIRIILRGYRYLFYRVYRYQLKGWKDVQIYAANIGVIAVAETTACNVISICFVLNLIPGVHIHVSKWIFLGLLLTWLFFVYFIFIYRDRYKKIIKEFSDETPRQSIVRGIYVWCYAISTIVFLLASIFIFVHFNHAH